MEIVRRQDQGNRIPQHGNGNAYHNHCYNDGDELNIGLSRATLEFQVCKFSSTAEIPKWDPSVVKICRQEIW